MSGINQGNYFSQAVPPEINTVAITLCSLPEMNKLSQSALMDVIVRLFLNEFKDNVLQAASLTAFRLVSNNSPLSNNPYADYDQNHAKVANDLIPLISQLMTPLSDEIRSGSVYLGVDRGQVRFSRPYLNLSPC